MLSIEDDTMLADFANEATCRQAGPRKQMDESRSIYRSQRFRRPLNGKGYGLPILCDFGEARIGSTHESGPFVQPSIYRAPEVIFEMPWGSAVDIWNLGALVRISSVSSRYTLLTSSRSGICSKDSISSRIFSILEGVMIHLNTWH